MLSVTPEEKAAIRAKGGRLFIKCYPVAGFSLYEQPGIRPKNRDMTWQGSELRAADGLLAGISSTRGLAQPHNPHRHSNTIQAFRNYKLLRQLVAFQKRFRLLELPLPEIRPEFDRHTSNADVPQSGMPPLARCQEFHAPPSCSFATIRRPKTEKPRPSRASLVRSIFSAVAFVFSF
jgi:hypothetical protein